MTTPPTRSPNWSRRLAPYKEPVLKQSLWELAVTAVPLAALWTAAFWTAQAGYWWAAVPLAVLASGFVLRLFLIQHDCGHHAYFRSRQANDWLGRIAALFTLTPYAYWRDTHNAHHATSGDLDRQELGAILTQTVEQYRAASPWQRFLYRAYRNPIVLFGIAPSFLFFIQQRIPVGVMRTGWKPWASTLGSSLVTGALLAGLALWIGVLPALVVPAISILIAATVGIWLFYVQHQFEGVAWSRSHSWKPHDAALAGSSHYDLPRWLHWLTANIGVHHVHHLSSRIPCYRLPEVLRDHPELHAMSRIGVRESFGYARLTLWDEEAGRLISFRDLKRAPEPAAAMSMAA